MARLLLCVVVVMEQSRAVTMATGRWWWNVAMLRDKLVYQMEINKIYIYIYISE